MENERNNSAPHRATDRTLRAIEYVASSQSGRTFSQIVEHLNAPKSSIHPILRTLCEHGFLLYGPQTRLYKTGVRLFECGYSFLEQTDVLELIRDQMRLIVGVCSETCHFGILVGGDVLYLLKIDSPEPIRLYSSVGRRLPAYATGIGKALLSDHTLTMLKKLYPEGLIPVTPNTITSFDVLAEQLAAVRAMGLSYESEESDQHVRCVGVPIRKNGHIIAAVSITLPLFRAGEEKIHLIGALLQNARDRIEHIVSERDVDFNQM
jgi:DNA-binding IclR family transcriptional regulator